MKVEATFALTHTSLESGLTCLSNALGEGSAPMVVGLERSDWDIQKQEGPHCGGKKNCHTHLESTFNIKLKLYVPLDPSILH
jgi:hypothetical protein